MYFRICGLSRQRSAGTAMRPGDKGERKEKPGVPQRYRQRPGRAHARSYQTPNRSDERLWRERLLQKFHFDIVDLK
jgi:hypothetical protein